MAKCLRSFVVGMAALTLQSPTTTTTTAAAAVRQVPVGGKGIRSNRPLSSNLDDRIPSIGLGTWLSDRDKLAGAVEYALVESGYRHIDAAWIYKNEDKTGEGIAAALKNNDNNNNKKKKKNTGGHQVSSREDIWITSKLWNAHHRPDEAARAMRETLADLGVEYLDLYLMHWPVAFVPGKNDGGDDDDHNKLDETVSVLDTWRTMEDLVRANLTRYIGISNFAKKEVEMILDNCAIRPLVHEFETHPYLQQQEFVDWHHDQGIQVIAYSPFANTNPTYRDDDGDQSSSSSSDKEETTTTTLLNDPFWVQLAKRKNCTVAQAVLGWGLQRNTIVIPKSTSRQHLDENIRAACSEDGTPLVEFTEEEMREIRARDRKTRMNNPGKAWGVDLFSDLDDPTRLDDDDASESEDEDESESESDSGSEDESGSEDL